MKPTLRLYFLFAALLLTSLACKAVLLLPTPTLTPRPSSTPKPSPSPSPSATSTLYPTGTMTPTPTETPTPTPTEGPVGEFQIYYEVMIALDYVRADWTNIGPALEHRRLTGCSLAWGMASGSGIGVNETVIGGFIWAGAPEVYALQLGGERYTGFLTAQYGENKASCRKAINALLKSVHALRAYAEAGECRFAPAQRLKVGDTAVVLSSSYLRTEPRWAEETRIRLVGPAEKLTLQIISGPVCAIYNRGEYSYWQVQLSSGEKGWMAEGDLKEYYLGVKE